jgi:hypothetical protein
MARLRIGGVSNDVFMQLECRTRNVSNLPEIHGSIMGGRFPEAEVAEFGQPRVADFRQDKEES